MNFKIVLRKIIARVSPKLLLTLDNYHHYHKFIDWKNPKDWNEKQCWLSFNTDTTKWSELADKYLVRNYIEQKGYSHLLTKLYGVWDKAEKIDFSKLPNSFVLKTNHGCATNILVRDKLSLNINLTVSQLNKWLNMVFGYPCEPHYSRIKPRIIAEEYLIQDGGISSSLIDYKVFVGGGKNVLY